MPISVLIADPQFLTREGLYASLNREEDLQVMTVDNWLKIQSVAITGLPDVLILDYAEDKLTFENREQLSQLVMLYNNVLIISADQNKQRIREVISLGVKGFLSKSCTKEEILMAIRMISNSNRFFCNKVLDIIMETPKQPEKAHSTLSERELEVLKLIATGYTTAKIADKLHISIHTVNSHRKNILKKLALKSPTQLVAYAHEMGLINF